ncbi:MAG: class I SAM-dependent methyltransferase [Candidatus Thorarchaeota archaeon]
MELRELGISNSFDELKPKTWGGFWDIFGENLVDLLDIQEGFRILDIGTGGGSVLYPLARKVGNSGYVVGVEICEHCAETTNQEIKRCKVGNAKVHFMDARGARFDEQSFDCITAGFIGWDNYFDFQTLEYKKSDDLMAAICRHLKSGGKFGISTWLLQEDLDWMYEFLTSQSIRSRINYTIENEKGWRKILSEAGFYDIQVFTRSASFTYDSIDFWWKEMMDYDWLVEGKNNDAISDSIKAAAFKSIKKRMTKRGGIPFKRDALLVTAI